MTPIEAVTSVFRNYANFNGRAQRSEFWWFVLFSLISQAILNLVPILGTIYSLALILPMLAVTARRLHDTNRTAWWLILYAVAVLGWVVGTIIFLIAAFSAVAFWDSQWSYESEVAFLGVAFIVFLVLLVAGIAAAISLWVLCASAGTAGPNRFGPDPLQTSGAAPGFSAAGHPYEPSTPTAGFGGFDPVPEPAPPHPDLPQAGQSQPAPERQRRYCTQCGTQLQPDARFCIYCGTGL